MQQDLTEIQRATVRAIARMTVERGFPPTLKELARVLKIGPTGVLSRLKGLQRKGVVDWHPACPRTLRILTQ